MPPSFSIITVCKNSEKTISRTFEAMLAQTCTDYEYLVIDGLSEDSTLDIIRNYEKRFAGRMKWISESDSGLYDAMNKGVRIAEGRLIGICNSDDFYEPDALERILSSAGKTPGQDVYYGYVRYLSEDDRELKVIRETPLVLSHHQLQHPGCFVAKKTYEKFGSFDLRYKMSADYDFMLRLDKGKALFSTVEAVISNYSTTGISSDFAACCLESVRLRMKYGFVSYFYYFLVRVWSIFYRISLFRRYK